MNGYVEISVLWAKVAGRILYGDSASDNASPVMNQPVIPLLFEIMRGVQTNSMNEITKLLKAWNNGDKEALNKVLEQLVPELKRAAHNYMAGERPGHILQTTALVNEALVGLIPEQLSFENRRHFYRMVARRMRRVLIDYAREQSTIKRGKRTIDQIDDCMPPERSTERSKDLRMLDAALRKLAKEDKEKATIVECHFYIGLSIAEVAKLLGLPKTKVERDWKFTRAWLKREMTGESM